MEACHAQAMVARAQAARGVQGRAHRGRGRHPCQQLQRQLLETIQVAALGKMIQRKNKKCK